MRSLLEIHLPICEDLINASIPSAITITGLTQVLKNLVAEGISVRDMPRILQAISEYHQEKEHGYLPTLSLKSVSPYIKNQMRIMQQSNGVGLNMLDMLADIRVALKRTICLHLTKDPLSIKVWSLSPYLDKDLTSQAISSPCMSSEILKAISSAFAKLLEVNNLSNITSQNTEHESDSFIVVLASRYSRALCASVAISERLPIKIITSEEIPDDMRVVIEGACE